ncbi:hypothetical protein WI29_00455 [Burkholderia ubonensis]|nr:hypothetical protein WI31_28280 [Burkholderia ubonensis]KUZ22029.1 hypothetical protein WI29_00455 [Burkholderia ubonensis]KUZ28484.1 hypothetical protein WI30_24470 [Burkholderia ubonensis]KUZ39887.1 hypothetical protein WI32_09470 [Burkholderia ubonensis]KUZ48952.1 hypothetical protein WI33_17995 [Burkholderia ubonensis]
MDQTTQQNAALVEQAAAASKSLEAQGHELSETVAAFRMSAGERAQSSASPDAAGARSAWRAVAA